jgi:hypothetical protein
MVVGNDDWDASIPKGFRQAGTPSTTSSWTQAEIAVCEVLLIELGLNPSIDHNDVALVCKSFAQKRTNRTIVRIPAMKASVERLVCSCGDADGFVSLRCSRHVGHEAPAEGGREMSL